MTSHTTFSIPADREELLSQDSEGCFAVREDIDIAKMSPVNVATTVDEVAQALKGKDPYVILANQVFDPLYALARGFSGLEGPVRTKVWRALLAGLKGLTKSFEQGLPEAQNAHEARNAVKMYMFILNWICMDEEAEAARATKHLSAASQKAAQVSGWAWSVERTRAVSAMGQLLQLGINRLWPMSCPEEQLVSLFTRVAYLLLENPAVLKDRSTKEDVFYLLGTLVHKYNHALGATTSIVHLLPHFEHLAGGMAELLQTLATEHDSGRVVGDVMREIGRMDSKELARDASGARNYSVFLQELGDRLPDTVLANISVILPQLDGEAYPMRNAIISIIGSIIAKALPQDRSESSARTRDQLLDILQTRLHDTSAYVRGRCLSVWSTLATARIIPLARLRSVLTDLVSRLEDKSSIVRKQALIAVTAVLESNPFGDRLNASTLKSQLSGEQEKLNTLLGISPEDAAAAAAAAATATDKAEAEAEGEATPADGSGGEGQQAPGEGEEDGVSPSGEVAPAEEETVSGDAEAEQEDQGPAEEAEGPPPSEDAAAITKAKVVVKYLTDAAAFAMQMEAVIPIVCQLLASKSASDVVESINFVVVACHFQVDNAPAAARKMLMLMWSKDSHIKEAVMAAYKGLYLTPDPSVHTSAKARTAAIVKNLMGITVDASIGEMSSMEEMVCAMVENKTISSNALSLLWEVFSGRITGTTAEQSRAALVVLTMAARTRQELVQDNVGLLLSVGLEQAGDDFLLVRDTCLALQRLAKPKAKKGTSSNEPSRLPQDHQLFVSLSQAITKPISGSEAGWVPACEQAINTIYLLAEHPDHVCGSILNRLQAGVFGQGAAGSVAALTRLLYACGQTALKQLVHLDEIQSEIKRRRTIEDERKEEKVKKTEKDADAEDMGVGGASAEDVEAEFISRICEQELVSGTGMLGVYAPVVLAVCRSPAKYPQEALQTAAVLTLCKYMCASREFCDDNLQLLFSIMKTSKYASIRGNAMVALGDLAFRFPNLIEPWTSHLYSLLRDPEERVRKNAVMVLTHLILNDMIKVKGQISEMAVRIEDPVGRIADLTRLFFHELSNKGNAIYNILPDIISQLAEEEASGVTHEQFRSIMSYLFSFIRLDRQADSLVEKLCHRFRTTLDPNQWRKFAYCLTLLTYSERCLKTLKDQFPCYHDKLSDAEVYGCFADILGKVKKFVKPELKESIAELEERIAACHETGAADEETAQKAAKAGRRAARRKGAGKNDGAAAKGRKGRGRRAAARVDSSEEEMSSADEEVVIESDEEDLNATRAPAKSQASAEIEDDLLLDEGENETPNVSRKQRSKQAASRGKKAASARGRGRGRRAVVLDEAEDDLLI